MHGSSSVPQDLLAEIREFGGDMKETYGVPVEEIQEGIKHGVRKVNIDTDIRLAMTGAIRRYMAENPSKFDPRDYLKPAMAAAKGICKERYQQFGCAGMASKIKPVPLDKIASAIQIRRAQANHRLTDESFVRRRLPNHRCAFCIARRLCALSMPTASAAASAISISCAVSYASATRSCRAAPRGRNAASQSSGLLHSAPPEQRGKLRTRDR